MANWFCDTLHASGDSTGSSMDNPFHSIKTAFESTGYSPGDVCWIRRRSSFDSPSADIAPTDDGSRVAPIRMIGWPRNSKAGSATFTNGSRVISGIATITSDFEEHAARMLKNDTDGKWYMITAIIHKINYDGETGTFTEGLMVTSAGAGAGVGKIHRLIDNGLTGTLYIVVQSGSFADGDAITDEDTGAAIVNGATSDDGFLILRKYAGTTNTGNCTIEADEDYTEAQAIDDSTWTIKKTDYNGDSDDPPEIDMGANAFEVYMNHVYHWHLKAITFKNGISNMGTFWPHNTSNLFVKYCFFIQTQNTKCIANYSSIEVNIFEQCVFKGSYTGASQQGFNLTKSQFIILKNISVYNMGDFGLTLDVQSAKNTRCSNINIGIALPNGDDDLSLMQGNLSIKNLAVGGKNGSLFLNPSRIQTQLNIENYNQVLGVHRVVYGSTNFYMSSFAVVAGSGDPQKRTGGADKIIDFMQQYNLVYGAHKSWPIILTEFKIWADTTSKSYRIYVQAKDCSTTTWDVLFLELDYIDAYDDVNEYHEVTIQSDKTISQRSGTTDWSQYIEIPNIKPAVAGLVNIRICVGPFYDSNGHLFIDPKPEILVGG